MNIPGHTLTRTSKVVGGSEYGKFYRDTVNCDMCGWENEDFGDELRLHVQHLTHAFSVLSVMLSQQTRVDGTSILARMEQTGD